MNRLLRLATLVCFVSSAAGCTSGGGDDDDVVNCNFSGPASALVGGGNLQLGFVNMSDGADMTVVLGPQNLYMVTPSIRVQNMYPGQAGRTGNSNDPEVRIELFMGDNLIGGSARENLGLSQSAEGAEALGIFAPFTAALNDYLGSTVIVKGTVEDACGRSASDELQVVTVQ